MKKFWPNKNSRHFDLDQNSYKNRTKRKQGSPRVSGLNRESTSKIGEDIGLSSTKEIDRAIRPSTNFGFKQQ